MLYSNNFVFSSSDLYRVFSKDDVSGYQDLEVYRLASLNQPSANSVFFIKKFSADHMTFIAEQKHSVFIIPRSVEDFATATNIIVRSDTPRLAYMKLASYIYENCNDEFSKGGYFTHTSGSTVSKSATLGDNVTISPNVFIGPNTVVEDNVTIFPNVSILGNTRIGSGTEIGSNSTIGNQGFGGERDGSDKIVMMPHLGGVIIESNVRIGANNTIVAGTIDPTVVGEQTKFDDHVHFAHNCVAGKACFITACAQFSGRVRLGDRVWVGPNCSLMQGVNVGDDATIGIGAVVTKHVADGETVAGSPAMKLTDFVKQRSIMKKLINE